MESVLVKTFAECIEIAGKDKPKHLVLGNGFSIALFPEIFNYKKLAEKISNQKIKDLFEKLKTNDFEFVMRRLFETSQVLKCYQNIDNIFEEINLNLQELKETLIEVVSDSHPDNPDLITLNQYQSVYKFLKNFDEGRKYTLNYDLILYWVYMHFLVNPKTALKCNDGFINNEDGVFWDIGQSTEQDLYFVHGAMHIFSDEENIQKCTWVNTGISIKNQVRNYIRENKYPVFISEGSNKHKLLRIRGNAYLYRAIASLRSISNSIFIFGHSLRDEDQHIFNLLNKNRRLKTIFISLFKDNNGFYDRVVIDKVKI